MSVARFPVARHLRLPIRRVLLMMTLVAAMVGIIAGFQTASVASVDAALCDSRCPIGALERGVIGHELAVDSISRSQPALCAEEENEALSSPEVSDEVAGDLLIEGGPAGLGLLTNLIPTARAPPIAR